jgi:PLP dependent protein
MSVIAENLLRVRASMAEAAAESGRRAEDIRLIAVSKNRSLEMIEEARKAGQTAFGENRAQELRDKVLKADPGIEWHFIGHLQTNKVNMVVGNSALIHSIDSERLAEAVAARAESLGIQQEILVQVNISGEESKHGTDLGEASRLVEKVLGQAGLLLRGLMTIAPLVAEAEEARPFFRRLRELKDGLSRSFPEADLGCLSMGMSGDYKVAIEEGANMVRIGTAIFS